MTDLDTLCQSSISEVSALLKLCAVSPRDLTEAMLASIASLNPALGCYMTVVAERALRQAYAAEREIAQGRLAGPPAWNPDGRKGSLLYARHPHRSWIEDPRGLGAFLRHAHCRAPR